MKKQLLGAGLLLSSCLFMVGCAQGTNAKSIKSKLESAKYTVTITEASDYAATSGKVMFEGTTPEGFTEYVTASKINDSTKNVEQLLFAWVFDSIDHASAWSDKAFTKMTYIDTSNYESLTFKTGCHNNVVYYGTEQAVKDANLTL